MRSPLLLAALLAMTLPGCSGGAVSQTGKPGGQLTVSAASSLTDAFSEIGSRFEAAHPGARVVFNFGASSGLAQQIVSGAPADVFASASPEPMRLISAEALGSGGPTVFARNSLQIAVPSSNPGRVQGLADLSRPTLVVALCAPQVPCGSAAARALSAAGVVAKADTYEQDARAALTKVELGEVDAALVYRTDVLAADGKVVGIDFPEAAQAINDYEIVALRSSGDLDLAQLFVDFVRGRDGRALLAQAGFRAP